MSGAIVAPALPLIAENFKAVPHADLLSRLVITMPALAIALTGMFAGTLADRWGRRPLLLSALVLYAIAGTSGLYLDNLYAILAGRFLLGLAVAGIMTAASTMIGDLLQGESRQRFLGLQAACMSAGGVLFIPLGGVLTQFSYHAPFAVYAASLLVIPLAAATLAETRRPKSEQAPRPAATAARLSLAILIAILTLAILLQVAFYLGPVQAAFLIKDKFQGSGLASGIAVAVMTLTAAIVSLNFARITRGRSPWLIATVTSIGMSVGCFIIANASSFGMVVLGLAIFGVGAGFIMPNLMSWLMRLASESARGRATGALTAAIFAGQFLSPLVFQPAVRAGGVPLTCPHFLYQSL
ncbi:MAG: MFS transporter [Phycisphaerales bacterium]|nr:MFS transporter [Phycisphaerales bacterium]